MGEMGTGVRKVVKVEESERDKVPAPSSSRDDQYGHETGNRVQTPV